MEGTFQKLKFYAWWNCLRKCCKICMGFFGSKLGLIFMYILYEVKNIWSFSKNDMYYSRACLEMIAENRLTQHAPPDLYMMIAWVIENKKHLKCRKQNNF